MLNLVLKKKYRTDIIQEMCNQNQKALNMQGNEPPWLGVTIQKLSEPVSPELGVQDEWDAAGKHKINMFSMIRMIK